MALQTAIIVKSLRQPSSLAGFSLKTAVSLSCIFFIADVALPQSTMCIQPTLADLKKQVLMQMDRVVSLKAVIKSRRKHSDDKWATTVVGAAGISRYEQQWHAGFDNPESDAFAIERFYDGKYWNVFRPYERVYEVTQRFSGRTYSYKILRNFFLESLGWWPPGDPSPPLRRSRGSNSEPKFLKSVLSDKRCRLLERTELIDDVICWILEIPGVERLWVQCETGQVKRRDILRLRPEGEEEDVLVSIMLRDFQEVAEGVFLPATLERSFSGVTTVHRVVHYEVNSDLSKMFAIETPPGTIIFDRDTGSIEQEPGGFDFLELIVSRTNRRLQKSDASRFSVFRLCLSFLLGTIGWTTGRLLCASWRKRQSLLRMSPSSAALSNNNDDH